MYASRFEQAAANSSDNFFAVTYQGNILASRLLVINSKLTEERFTIESFKDRAQTDAIKRQILGKGETSN